MTVNLLKPRPCPQNNRNYKSATNRSWRSKKVLNPASGGLIFLLCMSLSSLTNHLHAQVSFTGLGDLGSPFPYSAAYGVSDDGMAVVGLSANSFNSYEAFLWTEADGMVGLGDLEGGNFNSSAWGVSSLNPGGYTVAGVGISQESGQPMSAEAFQWTAGAMTGLGDFPGGNQQSRAFSISADGSVIVGEGSGISGPGGSNANEAFRSVAGTLVGLGDLDGGTFNSRAYDVSGDGLLIVGQGRSTEGTEAFIWNEDDGMTGLGDLDGGTFSSVAYAISADGKFVVGHSQSDAGDGGTNVTEAFLWTAENGMTGLGTLYFDNFSSLANDVSNNGIVVGQSFGEFTTEAFLWSADLGMLRVTDFLDSEGVDFAGWTLQQAKAISADGRVIVGSGLNPSGRSEAWMVTIPVPEPSAVLVLAFAGLGVLCSRPKRLHCISPNGSKLPVT